MKDGSFDQHLSDIDFEEDFEIRKTPLPSEIPAPIQLNALPESLGKSGVIEALMSQNDDLMSRLGVALRRIAQLEDLVTGTETENKNLQAKYESLKDQVLVFKEKARLISERKNNEEFDFNSLKEQLQIMEIRYSELYQNQQAKEAKWLSENSKQAAENSRLNRYRNRILRVARSLQSKHKTLAASQRALTEKASQKESLYETMKTHLLEATEHIQKQKQEYDQELNALKSQFEASQTLVQKLTLEKEELEAVSENNVRLENEIVLHERKFEDYQLKTSTEITDLQSSMARYRNEAKELALTIETQQSEIEEKSQIIGDLNKESFALKEQVENLQALWKEQQRKLEKHIEKNTSLQKLNQELSLAINQYRRDLRDARERLDATQISENKNTAENSKSPELLEKIDQALGHLL